MRKSEIIIIAVIGLCGLIFLCPWFEIFIAFVVAILGWSYYHYWVNKSSYGPYLYFSCDPATSMVINWIGVVKKYQVPINSICAEICHEQTFPKNEIVKATSSKLTTETQMEQERFYYHFTFNNLKPDTRYYYRIIISANNQTRNQARNQTSNQINKQIIDCTNEKIVISGKKYFFKTMVDNTQDFTENLIVYGDDQTADPFPILAQITNHAQFKEKPQFMIHLGDINQDLWNLNQNNAFFTTKRKIFRHIPYIPVVGNHDMKPVSQFNAFYDINSKWYSFNIGNKLLFIILSGADSLIPNTSGQYEFLEENLKQASNQDRYAIICIHEGPYNIETNIPEERATAENRKYVVPLLEKYNHGFQRNIVLFNGHVHSYERVIKDNMTFLTVGACSNAKYYSKLIDSKNRKYNPDIAITEYGRQSFAVLSLKNGDLNICIKNFLNKTIESLDFKL